MTEIELLSQISKIFDSLITSEENILMAQKVGDGIRVNTGKSIFLFDSGVLNFKSKYTMMSTHQIARNKKLLEELIIQSKFYLLSVTPKEWGYKFRLYKGAKKVKTINLRLYVTRSPIICWTYIIRRFFSMKPKKS